MLMASECLPCPAKRPWHPGDRCLSGNGRGLVPVAHTRSVSTGESGCRDYSPSVRINFTPSSMLIIDNLVGSRPSFLTATGKLQPDGQRLTLSPEKQKPLLVSFQTKHLMVPALWSARATPLGTWQGGCSQERTARLP